MKHLITSIALAVASCSLYGQCVFTAPYTETFDSASTPSCWGNTGWLFANAATSGFPSPNNGAAGIGDLTGNGGYFAWRDASSSGSQDLTSPAIIDTAINNLGLAFWHYAHHPNAQQNNTLIVDFYDGSNWHLMVDSYTTNASHWQYRTVDLSGFTTGDSIKVRFRDQILTHLQDIIIEDVFIGELPTCMPPSNVVVDSVDSQTAVLNVTGNAGSHWEYEFGPANFAIGSGNRDTTAQMHILLNGLSPSTSYDIYVRNICSGDTSVWLKQSFTTGCGVYAAPFSESFDIAEDPPCWSTYLIPSGNVSLSYNPGYDRTGNGGYGAGRNFNIWTTKAALQTPMIDISGLNQPHLSFWQKFTTNSDDHASTPLAHAKVEVSSDELNWVPLDSFGILDPNWQYLPVALNGLGIGDSIYLRVIIETTENPSNGVAPSMYIDDLQVTEQPGCLPNDSVYVTDIVGTSAVAHLANQSSGQIEWGPAGFTHGNGTIGSIDDSLLMSNLRPATWYTVYFRDSCAGSVSEWGRPYHFQTICPAQLTFPYRESFNTIPDGDTDFTEACWSTYGTGAFQWVAGTSQEFATGPAHLHEGPYAYTEADDGQPGDIAYLESPLIDLSTAAFPHVSYHYYLYGSDIGDLCVEIFDGTQWDTVPTFPCFSGEQQSTDALAWWQRFIRLDGYSDTVKIRFGATRGAGKYGDISIDDIHFFDTCLALDPTASFAYNVDSLTSAGYYVTFTSGASNASDFRWDFGDGTTDTGAVVQHVFTSNQAFAVEHFALNICGVADTAYDTIAIAGVDLPEEVGFGPRFSMFPNPAGHEVTIELDEKDMDMVMRIENVAGQQVLKVRLSSNKETLNLSSLKPGLYLVTLKAGPHETVKRLSVY